MLVEFRLFQIIYRDGIEIKNRHCVFKFHQMLFIKISKFSKTKVVCYNQLLLLLTTEHCNKQIGIHAMHMIGQVIRGEKITMAQLVAGGNTNHCVQKAFRCLGFIPSILWWWLLCVFIFIIFFLGGGHLKLCNVQKVYCQCKGLGYSSSRFSVHAGISGLQFTHRHTQVHCCKGLPTHYITFFQTAYLCLEVDFKLELFYWHFREAAPVENSFKMGLDFQFVACIPILPRSS